MKYQRLTTEDMKSLEQEFIAFLVLNGIAAEEWENIKNTDTIATDKILDQFSDVIWEATLRKTKYLEKKEADAAYFFRCEEEIIYLKHVEKATEKVSFTSKKYNSSRENELFEMILSGCKISEGTIYEMLVL